MPTSQETHLTLKKRAIGFYNMKEWVKASDQIMIQVTWFTPEGMVEAHDQIMIQVTLELKVEFRKN